MPDERARVASETARSAHESIQEVVRLEADLRAHLTLQVSLLAEKESTRMLQILETLGERLGVAAPDEQVQRLVTPTDVPSLARELKENLPDE